ncbi:g200 [Yersinia phage phiR1-37]|nr:hypothetical protein phiR1-37_gp200 [Yersinia phage phiR1-37]CCE26223.1 g200 [Yersinia phage phiR1-37]
MRILFCNYTNIKIVIKSYSVATDQKSLYKGNKSWLCF